MKNFTFIAPLAVKQWFQPTLMADEITAISFAYINVIPIILLLCCFFKSVGSRGCVWQGTAGARRKNGLRSQFGAMCCLIQGTIHNGPNNQMLLAISFSKWQSAMHP
jgi:hypothetical protein